MSAPILQLVPADDSKQKFDLYGYAGAISERADLSPEHRDALDSFNRRVDCMSLGAEGGARIREIEAAALSGLHIGIEPTEIFKGVEFGARANCYGLHESSIRGAVQSAIRKHMGIPEEENPFSDKAAPFDPAASRIGDIFAAPPEPPRFIVQGLYPMACGQENSVGGLGKTTRRIWELIQIILGRDLYGHPVLQQGPGLFVTKEDGADIFRHRIYCVAKALDLSPADQRRITENLHVLDLTGDVSARLVAVDRDGNLRATDLADRIIRGYRREGLAQVILDPWNGFSPGERFVNDAEAALMAVGARIAQELTCNVCYVGHVSKAVGRQGIIDAHSGRGGAAMGDNARFVLNYVPHDPKDDSKAWPTPAAAEQAAAQGNLFRLHITKQSYARRPTEPLWIERQGFAFTIHKGPPESPTARLSADGERLKLFVQQELERGIKHTRNTLDEQHDRYGMSRSRARQVIAQLQAAGGLVERALPESERQGRRTHFIDPVFNPAPELDGGDPFQ